MRYLFRIYDLPDDICEDELIKLVEQYVITKAVFISCKNDIISRYAWIEFFNNDDLLRAYENMHEKYCIILAKL